ncbi:hypothetical protein C8R46DRAFT_1048242 [Mycena filopes]|nr:hypothetical protein C8R46DRAFT_1048242 [Mycena filopes]
MPIPPYVDLLAAPPDDFIPCAVRNHMSGNFKNHSEFSASHQQTYWVLFWASKENSDGMYSYKLNATQANRSCYEHDSMIGSVGTFREVLPAWAKHCFHHHRKCDVHAGACGNEATLCPSHPRQVVDAPRIKREGVEPRIKREPSSAPVRQRATRSKKRSGQKPPSASDSESDSDVVSPGGLPLYAPDITPPRSGRQAAGPHQDKRPRSASPAALATGAVDPPPSPSTMSTSITSISSISSEGMSAGVTGHPEADIGGRRKGKARMDATPVWARGLSAAAGPSAARASPSAARASGARSGGAGVSSASRARSAANRRGTPPPSMDGVFYVTSRGFIHQSETAAFSDVGEGLKVVVGWPEALEYAREAAERDQSASRVASAARTMDVDT